MFPKLFDVVMAMLAVVGFAVGLIAAIIMVLLMTKEVCAQGACITNTYFVEGKMVVCQTCCNGNNCNTVCF